MRISPFLGSTVILLSLALSGCGPRVVAEVGDDVKIYEDQLHASPEGAHQGMVQRVEGQVETGKEPVPEESRQTALGVGKRIKEWDLLAAIVQTEVLKKVAKEYNLGDALVPPDPLEVWIAHEMKERGRERRTLIFNSLIEVNSDLSNAMDVYNKYFPGEKNYVLWRIHLDQYLGRTPEEVSTALENLGKIIFAEVSQKDSLYQECVNKAEPSHICLREARARWWEQKYEKLGVRILASRYYGAQKVFQEQYIVDFKFDPIPPTPTPTPVWP
jgi:hypothetical protein